MQNGIFSSHAHLTLLTRTHVQDKTNVPKEYFVLGGGFLLSIAFLSGIGTQPLCLVIGFLFPAFKSVRAMETHNSSEVTQWLVYWVVYAFFSVIEIFVDTLVYWIPFYFRFKLGFLMWAMLVSSIVETLCGELALNYRVPLAQYISHLTPPPHNLPFSLKLVVQNTSMTIS